MTRRTPWLLALAVGLLPTCGVLAAQDLGGVLQHGAGAPRVGLLQQYLGQQEHGLPVLLVVPDHPEELGLGVLQVAPVEERLAEAYSEAGEATLGLQREVASLEGRRADLRQERVAPELRLLGLILGARGSDAAAELHTLYAELSGLLGASR